ncbi:MAG: hypothetical protein II135_03730, partial [Clostridia bacterium]|nr:hypothetical protein [Clostridia bacterium]
NKIRVTGEEIDLLTGKNVPGNRDPYVYALSLDRKLRIAGYPLHISYRKNEGFRLVDDNE